MLIKIKRGWEIPESAATPEDVFLNRRQFLGGTAAGALAASMLSPMALAADEPDPSAKPDPAPRSLCDRLELDISDEKLATTYNNYYEFGSSKNVWSDAQKLPIRPWEIRIDGMVEQPRTVAIDDLFAQMQFEERTYRHRCV